MAAASAATVAEGDVGMEDAVAITDAEARVLLQRTDAWDIERWRVCVCGLALEREHEHKPDDVDNDFYNFDDMPCDVSVMFAGWLAPPMTFFLNCGVIGCLDLSRCGLQSLPQALFSLRGVTHLHLAHNECLSCIDGIGQLRELVRLDVSHCDLSAIPTEIGQLQLLEFVDFSENVAITELPNSLAECSALTMLWVMHCNLLVSLPDALGACERLQTIMCSYSLRIVISAEALLSAEKLYAVGCELPAHSLINIAAMVRSNVNPKLHAIYVGDAHTEATKEVVDAFERALRSNSSLKHLEGVTSTYIEAALARNCRGEPAPEPCTPRVKAAR